MKNPGQEGYWSELKEAERTPIEAIQSACNDGDILHSVIPIELDSDERELKAIAVREQNDGKTLHIRQCYVDLAEPGSVKWTQNGIVIPTGNGAEGVAAAFRVSSAATSDMWGTEHKPVPAPQAAESISEMDNLLRSPISETLRSIEESEAEPEPEIEPEPEPEIPAGKEQCDKCGEIDDIEKLSQYSEGPPLGDLWVHAKTADCNGGSA